MEIENISQKHLLELEQRVGELLATMRKIKVKDDPLVVSLKELEKQLGEARRARFDASNSEYQSY